MLSTGSVSIPKSVKSIPLSEESCPPPRAAKAAFFDQVAQAPWSAEPYTVGEKQWLRALLARVPVESGDRILEPGCGTGRLTQLLAEQVGPSGRILACDISPVMLQLAAQNTATLPQVTLLQEPAEFLSLGTHSLKLVLCHQVFPHLEDPATALRSWRRALQPGGRIILSHFRSSSEISHHHGKAHPAVANDSLPPAPELARWIASFGYRIDAFLDSETDGFQILATTPASSV